MSYIDYGIILAFLSSVLFYGLYSSQRKQNLQDYFIANNQVHWVSAMFSIVATETSVLTFISIPGLAFREDNWFFLQLALGYIVGRILVSYILLPNYFNQGVTSIYEIIGKKFGSTVQKITSLTFLVTRVFADGVRFLATALIVNVLTGWNLTVSILVIGIITLVYSIYGGIKTIIKLDVIQFGIYIIGGIITLGYIVNQLPDSNFILEDIFFNKPKIKNFTDSLFLDSYFFYNAFFGGIFLSFASHGVDYMMVQRALSTKNINSAKKAMIGSGFFVLLQFSIFMCIGFLLVNMFGAIQPIKDREFARFILWNLPVGIRGLLVAGVLSAAMSTLSSSINSLASSTLVDWFGIKNITLKKSMIVSFIWAIVLILIASVFNEENTALVIIGLKIASFTYGGLLGLFLLSRIKLSFRSSDVLFSFFISILMMFVLYYMNITWTLWIFVGTSTTVLVSLFLYFIFNKNFNTVLKIGIFVPFAFFFINNSSVSKSITIIDSIQSQNENIILYGADNLIDENLHLARDKRIALLYNEQSKTSKNQDILDIMIQNGLNVQLLLFPEHGPEAALDAGKNFDNGSYKGINYISLYSDKREPSKDDLKDIDIIVYDLQDVGSRYYTYISTMTYAMQAAAKNNIEFIVLDRPNPINGLSIDGQINRENSFVGMHEIPIRHGMTSGELAQMIFSENWCECNSLKLTIVKMSGWERKRYFDEYDNTWYSPSPNIPSIETALAYNGLCLLEGTNVSEGRGSSSPFLNFGAPWIDSKLLKNEILKYNLEGFELKEIVFKPTSSKYRDEVCNGLNLKITNYDLFNPLKFSVILINILNQEFPNEFNFYYKKDTDFIKNLYGSNELRYITDLNYCEDYCVQNNISKSICKNNNINQLFDQWDDMIIKFKKDRKEYLLY